MNKRTHYTPEFKSRIVIEALREEETVNEIAAQEGLSPVLISRWKAEFLENAAILFKKGGPAEAEKALATERERVANLERKVGQLTYEVDWLKKKSEQILGRKRP